MDQETFTRAYLLYLVLPLWVAVGFADWLCHRASRIESTSGPKESMIHLLLLAEGGAGLLLGAFFEIHALVLLLMLGCFLAHEATNLWDLSYAIPRRHISAIEQHVHDYLAVIPFMALSLVAVLHWPQALALVGLGPETARFELRFKDEPLPWSYVTALFGAVALFDFLPFLEELLRGLRARRLAPPAAASLPGDARGR